MLENNKFTLNRNSRILIFSLRSLESHVSRCPLYEFEDVVSSVDKVDIISPDSYANLFRFTSRISNSIIKRLPNSHHLLNPSLKSIKIQKEYDLLLFICQTPLDIISLNYLKDWRRKCHKVVCLLDEVWIKKIPGFRNILQGLQNFDYVFMTIHSSINAVKNAVQLPCEYLPSGVDTIKFCPYPILPHRSIGLYSFGRRSDTAHKALLELAEKQDFLYIYDTMKDLFINDWKEHRNLYANLIKRSNYVIVNKAKFDDPVIGNQQQGGPRYFEAAAGGAILIGMTPDCEIFNSQLNWQDAVIKIPFDGANIGEIITGLNAQPERLRKIRRDGVVNALLRHDWVYRWEKILQTVGLEPLPTLNARKAHLQDLAELVDKKFRQVNTSTSSINSASFV